MSEREADRAHPERLLQQAVVALGCDADREISPEFRRRLRQHNSAPNLFDAHDLAESARTELEIDIARNIQAGPGSIRRTLSVTRCAGEANATPGAEMSADCRASS